MYPEIFDDLFVRDKASFLELSEKHQVAFCIYQLEAQVNNGGFNQFFFNSSGGYAIETLSALRKIGADNTAALLDKAVKLGYPNGYPTDSAQHREQLTEDERVEEQLSSLDDVFYQYEDDLAGLTNTYLGYATPA